MILLLPLALVWGYHSYGRLILIRHKWRGLFVPFDV